MMLHRIFALAALVLLCAQSPLSSFPPGAFSGRAALSGVGGSSWTLIAHTLAGATNDPSTSAIDSSGGNIIAIAIGQFNGIGIGTLTDSKSNTWTGLTAKIGPNESYNRIFYCSPCTVGSGHTFTWNGSPVFGAIAVQVWSGANATPFDVQNGATATPGTTIQPGTVTPSQNNSLIITSVDPTGVTTAGSYLIDNGFTITDSINAQAGIEGLAMAYLVQSTAGAINPNWSWTGISNDSAATIAVFKP